MSEQPKVTVYGNRTCSYCGAARMLLTKKAVEFQDIVITDDPSLEKEMLERGVGHTVPQIFIGDIHVGGSDDLHALERQGKLDALLAA